MPTINLSQTSLLNVVIVLFSFLFQTRRLSGSITQKISSHPMHNLQRRCSVQTEGSHYIPSTPASTSPDLQQSRFQCIQKAPLRSALSAPNPNMSNTLCNRPLPQQPLVQRQDTVQSTSMESIESAAALQPARYKTELCRPFEETGQCRYGAKCQFAHGMQELRSLNRHPKYKTELCRTFHTTGLCSYGQRCNFIHNDEERRGPAPSTTASVSPANTQGMPPGSMVVPIHAPLTIVSTGDSPTCSVSSGSPSQSPAYLHDDVFRVRMSPTPSYGSDGASLASTYTPPGSPKQDELLTDHMPSPLDMGFSISLFGKLGL